MIPIPGKPGHFRVVDDETITVRLTKTQNVQDSVNYTWNDVGQPPQPISVPFQRKVTNQDPDPCRLGTLVHFFDDNGGSFTVVLSGDKGGPPYPDPCTGGGTFTDVEYWFERG